jgi:hypothetical protein
MIRLLMKELSGETEVFEENLTKCLFAHKSHVICPWRVPGPLQWVAGDPLINLSAF